MNSIKKQFNLTFVYKLLLAALLVTFVACAKKVHFQTSNVVPAARGTVSIVKDNNQNYVISVKLFNLAEGNRLPTDEHTYVVWLESGSQAVKNMGQINSNTKLFSKKLKASFEGVSAVKPTKIFITAEITSGVEFPSNELILTTDKF